MRHQVLLLSTLCKTDSTREHSPILFMISEEIVKMNESTRCYLYAKSRASSKGQEAKANDTGCDKEERDREDREHTDSRFQIYEESGE